MRREASFGEVWRAIQHAFLSLKDWHENHELYHKIGYLIASEHMTLKDVFDLSAHRTKGDFVSRLDDCIRPSVKIDGNYADLSYEKSQEYARISRLLLLFNVESVRQNGEHTQWFPFDKYKRGERGRATWSLEHIHAQQSEALRTQEGWKEWLRLHVPSVVAVAGEGDLAEAMRAAVERPRLERPEFDDLQQRAVALLSVQGNAEYLHSISNLALIESGDNAALSNSTFDVKRNMVLEMDRRGQFIPFCTKMVFLKYYTPSEGNQLHFWGRADRIAYVEAMNTVLAPYLTEPIDIAEE